MEAFKRQRWGRGGTFGLEEKRVLLGPWAGRSGLDGPRPNGTGVERLWFDFFFFFLSFLWLVVMEAGLVQ